MVLWGQRQARDETTRTGSEHLLCALSGLDLELVASQRAAPGLGPGCKYAQKTVHGALSWLCDPSGLENAGSRRKRVLAADLADLALTGAGERATELDRVGAHGSRVVCPLALRAHCETRMAPIHAHQ